MLLIKRCEASSKIWHPKKNKPFFVQFPSVECNRSNKESRYQLTGIKLHTVKDAGSLRLQNNIHFTPIEVRRCSITCQHLFEVEQPPKASILDYLDSYKCRRSYFELILSEKKRENFLPLFSLAYWCDLPLACPLSSLLHSNFFHSGEKKTEHGLFFNSFVNCHHFQNKGNCLNLSISFKFIPPLQISYDLN